MKEDLEKLELMIKNDSRYEDIIEQSMQMKRKSRERYSFLIFMFHIWNAMNVILIRWNTNQGE